MSRIYLTHRDGRRTVADDESEAQRYEERGYVRDDAPVKRTRRPRKPKTDDTE